MKYTFLHVALTAAFILLSLAPSDAWAQNTQRFFDMAGDIPLMAGMTEMNEHGVLFDTSDGRIVTLLAYTEKEEATIRAFYDETLKALGWSAQSYNQYKRAGETLTLDISSPADIRIVSIRLFPE